MSEVVERVKDFFRRKKISYQNVFSKDSEATKAVLADLAKFCRANETTFLPDQRAHAVLEGRREVWLRIQSYLRLSTDELYNLYGKKD